MSKPFSVEVHVYEDRTGMLRASVRQYVLDKHPGLALHPSRPVVVASFRNTNMSELLKSVANELYLMREKNDVDSDGP